MNPRTTGILLVIAGALLAFVYFYEIRGEEAREEAKRAEKRLFDLEAAEVGSLSFTTSDEQEVALARVESGWELREPLVFPADEFSADAIVTALVALESESIYESPEEPASYGLGGDAQELRFRAGDRDYLARIGDETPMGSETYVGIGSSDSIYTVQSASLTPLRKSLEDLRDKRITSFDTVAIDRVEARWPEGGRVVAERDAEGWRLVHPIEARADGDTVDSLLTDLAFLRASGFQDTPLPEAETGLDEPAFRVSLRSAAQAEGEQARRIALDFGQGAAGDVLFVRVPEQETLYRVSTARLADLPRELVAWRFKQLAAFPIVEAQRVELSMQRLSSTGEGDEPLRIVASRGAQGWESTPERFQPGKVALMISALSRLKAERILADEMGAEELAALGLAPPQVSIAVYDGTGEVLGHVRLGVVREDGSVVAQREDEPMVFALPGSVADSLPTSLEAFRSEFRSEEEPLAEPEAEGGELSPGLE